MEDNELSERDKKFLLQSQLIYAAEDGDIESIKSLISQGADVHADDVLLRAAKANAVSVFEFFASSNIEIDIFDDLVIHVAMENKSMKVVKFLIEYSAIICKELNPKGSYKNQFLEIQTSLYEKKLLEEDFKRLNF